MNRGIRFASHERRATGDERIGSALILTVVLTSLLAMVGVLFVMMARVNQIATSGLSESKELDAAIETVIAKISEELVLDTPGVAGAEYYDYPGSEDKWLASLEPYDNGGYKWRQISDITGYFPDPCVKDVPVDVIGEHDEVTKLADADGDGVADSKWVEVNDITSSQGKPIYAAIRIVDNGGMLNVNTAYKFDANETDRDLIDGSSQMQINLAALALRGDNGGLDAAAEDLQEERCGQESTDLDSYEENVIWRYDRPDGSYTPFDISDELELRNRFTLNQGDFDSRVEDVWSSAFKGQGYLRVPVDSTSSFGDWSEEVYYDLSEPNAPNDYSYRHIATIYNMDRIITPYGAKMTNVSDANVNDLYDSISRGLLDANYPDVNGVAAQVTVNLIDFRDNDSNVTSINVDGTTYYGFERPCVYISELAHNFKRVLVPGGVGPSPGIDYITYRSYAIELYKPYSEDPDPNQWQLSIEGYPNSPIPINWSDNENFHVILFQDPCVPLDVDPNFAGSVQGPPFDRYSKVFENGSLIELRRRVGDVNGVWITVDSTYVPDASPASGWLISAPNSVARSVQRDITRHKCIRRLLAGAAEASTPTLGGDNNFQYAESPDVYIQAHPADGPFANIGEIGMVFRRGAYYQDLVERDERIGYGTNKTEEEVRLDLTKPEFQQVFNYLTVWPPGYVDPNEVRVKGRININTAPWYVLAQLPWMQYTAAGDDYWRAQRIADNGPYKNIGELMRVAEMRSLDLDDVDNSNTDDPKGPDLTEDTAQDDFEERDLILTRISNLVTVRSDVFTAYILVRIGTDGPQKRVVAILDRSDVYSPTDRVKIVAVHPAADPR